MSTQMWSEFFAGVVCLRIALQLQNNNFKYVYIAFIQMLIYK